VNNAKPAVMLRRSLAGMRFYSKEFIMLNKKILLTVLAALLLVGLFSGCFEESEKKPDTPGNISTSVLTTGIRITWNPVSNTDNYVIYRREGTSGNGEQLTSDVNSSTDEYTDTTGTPGTSYSYAVAARNSVGTSDRSSWSEPKVFPGSEIPVAPTNVTAVAQGSGSITISWTGSTGAVGYKVYQDESASGNFSTCVSGESPWTGTSYTDTGLQANKDYFYKISAVNSAGESDKSSPAATAKTGPASGGTEIDYNSYYLSNDYAFLIRNYSNQKLVAFKGTLQKANIVGGIPANTYIHGIKNDATKFTVSQGFTLTILTEDQYLANENSLGNSLIIPYARIFIAYNKNGTNEKVYEVNSHSGGNYTIQIHNNTGMNIELRRDGIAGIPIGFAPENMDNVTFYVDRGDYMLYPVFLKYNSLRDELSTVYPKFDSDGTALRAQITVDDGGRNQIFPLAQLLTQDYKFSTGTAHLIIRNEFMGGSLDLQIGLDRVLNLWGTYGIRPNEERTFPVLMTKTGDNKYETSQSIRTYSIGMTGTRIEIGNYELELDKVYKVTATGTNIANLQISAPEEIGTIDLSDFYPVDD